MRWGKNTAFGLIAVMTLGRADFTVPSSLELGDLHIAISANNVRASYQSPRKTRYDESLWSVAKGYA